MTKDLHIPATRESEGILEHEHHTELVKVVLFYLLNRRQPIPTAEASSQLPLQPPAATEVARRETERRARERERQGEAFIAGELSDTELGRWDISLCTGSGLR